MANERLTEGIVRNHFNEFLNEIIIEEQQSKNLITDNQYFILT